MQNKLYQGTVMIKITDKALFELYIDALKRGGSRTRMLSDDDLGYNIFEEYDTGITSYLYDSSLERLHIAGYIDDEMVSISRDIREKGLSLLERKREFENVRHDSEWRHVMELADTVIQLILAKGGEAAEMANKEREKWDIADC